MPRDGATVFSDLTGKLEVLRVSCDKCGRDGCYGLHRLIESVAAFLQPQQVPSDGKGAS